MDKAVIKSLEELQAKFGNNFEIVVRIERKKLSAVNVPNGVSDVPVGTSQFCRCCATIKSEKVSATNDRLLSLVHRMFTNT